MTYTCKICKIFNYSLLHILNKGCIISPSSSISSNLAQNTWYGLISEAHQSHIPCAEDKTLKGNKGQQKNLMHFTVYGTSFPQTPSFIPSVNHIREVFDCSYMHTCYTCMYSVKLCNHSYMYSISYCFKFNYYIYNGREKIHPKTCHKINNILLNWIHYDARLQTWGVSSSMQRAPPLST